MDQPQGDTQPVKAELGLWDAISIILGIIIGATIYETPPGTYGIYQNVPSVGWALGIWVLVGALSLIGALTYAELATTYPRSGGDYNYLTRAFGPWMGFLFGWAQLTVIHTGGIGLLAYVFADYTHTLFWGKGEEGKQLAFLFAAGAVVILTAMNLLGLVAGKWTQNVLTAAKVLGLVGIVVAGLGFSQPKEHVQGTVVSTSGDKLIVAVGDNEKRSFLVTDKVDIVGLRERSQLRGLPRGRDKHDLGDLPADVPVTVQVMKSDSERALRVEERAPPQPGPGFGLAMVLVFLAFSGYNDAAYVAAEVRNRRRNLPLALILGVAGVTVIYLLINAAYIFGLGFDEARRSSAIAADVLGLFLGERGEKAMCVLVMVSALGAINGSILTGSRVFSTLGTDHRIFGWMGGWSLRFNVPTVALLTQGLISLIMILGVGTTPGQTALDTIFKTLGMEEQKWAGQSGFNTLLKFTTPVFWLFFLLTSLSLFVLRERDRHVERPFSVPFYPLLPLFFTGICIYMLHSGINYAGQLGLVGAGLLVIGLALYLVSTDREMTGGGPGGSGGN